MGQNIKSRNGLPFNFVDGLALNNSKIYYSDAMPITGEWNSGDRVFNSALSELGTTGNKYILTGWARIATGNDNALNVDWVEMRNLTGN
jgi:hypothetical protein